MSKSPIRINSIVAGMVSSSIPSVSPRADSYRLLNKQQTVIADACTSLPILTPLKTKTLSWLLLCRQSHKFQ